MSKIFDHFLYVVFLHLLPFFTNSIESSSYRKSNHTLKATSQWESWGGLVGGWRDHNGKSQQYLQSAELNYQWRLVQHSFAESWCSNQKTIDLFPKEMHLVFYITTPQITKWQKWTQIASNLSPSRFCHMNQQWHELLITSSKDIARANCTCWKAINIIGK